MTKNYLTLPFLVLCRLLLQTGIDTAFAQYPPPRLPLNIEQSMHLRHGERALILFVNPGTCSACTSRECGTAALLRAEGYKSTRIRLVAAVQGDREVALHIFKRTYGWDEEAILDSSASLRAKLLLPKNTRVAVYGSDHHLAGTVSAGTNDLIDWSQVQNILRSH